MKRPQDDRLTRRRRRILRSASVAFSAGAVALVLVEPSPAVARTIAVASLALLATVLFAGERIVVYLRSQYARELVETGTTLASLTDQHRATQWATTEVLKALDLREGASVAEIGAGGGFFVKLIAERVGPTGHVLATDVSPAMVGRVVAMAERLGLRNIEPSVVSADTPLAARRQLDRILIANVYCFTHNNEKQARAWFASWASMLASGGRMVIFHEFVHLVGWRPDPAFSPLTNDQLTGEELASVAGGSFVVESLTPTPAPTRPYQPHEQAGYLLVLRRREP